MGYASTEPNVAYNNHNQKLAWTLENMIFYNKTFNKIHTVGLTLIQQRIQKLRTVLHMRMRRWNSRSEWITVCILQL